MALVGEAHVIVRAVTTGVRNDIKRGFNGLGGVASSAGRDVGRQFSNGFNRAAGDGRAFDTFRNSLRNLVSESQSVQQAFTSLSRTSRTLGTAFVGAVGGISSLIGGLVSLVGAAAGAAASLASIGNVVAGLGLGLGVAKLALGGVGGALSKLNAPGG